LEWCGACAIGWFLFNLSIHFDRGGRRSAMREVVSRSQLSPILSATGIISQEVKDLILTLDEYGPG
jgi:hypothetical protein